MKEAAFYTALLENPECAFLLEAGEGHYGALQKKAAVLVPPDLNVVEFGCGTGRFAEILKERQLASYLGIDFSEAMIQEARRYTGLDFMLADLRICDIPTADVYVALEVLEHLDDDLELLETLPTGARIVMSLPDFDSESHVRFFPELADAKERYSEFVEFDYADTIYIARLSRFFLFSGVLQ